MKILRLITYAVTTAVLAIGCDEGIDPISHVPPGEDVNPPTIEITYPVEGSRIRVKEDVMPIEFRFHAEDDIEIVSVSFTLDGTNIGEVTEFKDYRVAFQNFWYDQLTNGSHTLVATVTDVTGKTASTSITFEKLEPYEPVYDGETFYLPFDGDFTDLVNLVEGSIAGVPGFSDEGYLDKAYKGASGAYVAYPINTIATEEISVVFWYKMNPVPDRAGILTVSPPDPNNPNAPNNRTSGFRLFREAAGDKQRFKLNVGNGETDGWFETGPSTDLEAPDEWVHIAFTIGTGHTTFYINGECVSEGDFDGVSWAQCNSMSFASGAPRFTGWDHFSDESLYDELRIFNRVLAQDEIQAMIN